MDSDPARQSPLSVESAKARLFDEAPSFEQAFIKDPTALIRQHPREAIGIALATGIVLGIAPKLRQSLLSAAVEAAKIIVT